ncbi:hypothetical protein DXG03_004831 [Asterophora parasitica]|uniref:Uncharacterized protein n=1 Tax=Asterophora parasitica TaxID=117018 RepID=A0A9P7G656_9AGAR|nr:hypothetical protein DXG03_004831 [Asterophora parasitica]
MRTSQILFSGLAILVWSVTEVYASVYPSISLANGISRGRPGVEKRHIRNADYQSSGASPKSVYEETGNSAPSDSTDPAPHEQQPSGPSSNTKERRGLFGLPDISLTQAAGSNPTKSDLPLMNSVPLNDQTDIPFCDQLVELVPGLAHSEGMMMKRGASRIHVRGYGPACIRRMIPVGTKGSGRSGKFLSRSLTRGDKPQERRMDAIQYTRGFIQIHQVREPWRTPGYPIAAPQHGQGLAKHAAPIVSTPAPISDMAPRSFPPLGHPRAFGIERPTISKPDAMQNDRRWVPQRDTTTLHALTKPVHDERAEHGQGA